MTTDAQYKKSWVITTQIAREILCHQPGDRLPAVQDYSLWYESSRGIVQNALKKLQDSGAVVLEKRGKIGSFLTSMDERLLFDLADLRYITGSMPPPLNRHYSSLASAVCTAITTCPCTFNFAFMHSAENRVAALQRMVYDFAIVSLHSAKRLVELYPEMEIGLVLDDCLYSPPFALLSNTPGATAITDGCTIAVDPKSTDQYHITMDLCRDKRVHIIHAPYIKCGALFAAGQVDFMVYREGEHTRSVPPQLTPIVSSQNREMTTPAVLINRGNYALGRILSKYLSVSDLRIYQQEVLAGVRDADFY